MNYHAIACAGLEQEVCHLAVHSPLALRLSFVEPEERAIEEALAGLKGQALDGVLLALPITSLEEGLHNPLEIPLILPRVHDRFHLLLGSTRRYEQLQEQLGGGIYFYHSYLARMGRLDTCNHVHRRPEAVCVLTSPLEDPAESLAAGAAMAETLGVPCLERAESLGQLGRLLSGDWREGETLLLPPGGVAEASYRRDILRLRP